MRTILHPDYWVEIPEGEFIFGLTEENLLRLHEQLKEQIGYIQRPKHERKLIDCALRKLRAGQLLSEAEETVFRLDSPSEIYIWKFAHVFPGRTIWLKRFYIARYEITAKQFRQGKHPSELPGALEEPETIYSERMKRSVYARPPAEVDIKPALQFCEQLGGRLPTIYEWEKAARGTDGRLYPWGNNWNPNAGFFSYIGSTHHPIPNTTGKPNVDSYPQGVSPYGVWGMMGYPPELVAVPPKLRILTFEFRGRQMSSEQFIWIEEFKGENLYIDVKATHPKDIDPVRSPIEHFVPKRGGSEWLWVGLRPVLDKWPQQSWSGYDMPK